MKIVITGGQGFLGQRLAKSLLRMTTLFPLELVLIDQIPPIAPFLTENGQKVRGETLDLCNPQGLAELVGTETDVIFHLSAVVSSHAEAEFEVGYAVNFEATRNLLEICRRQSPHTRFVFASSVAVFGGDLPEVIETSTAATPQSSYGTQKAMGELLVNDYSRKGFVDGLAVRLPTIAIRPGRPNRAASSFVSSIIREPLNGEKAICPVSPDLKLWLSSPDTVVENLIHAGLMPRLPKTAWHVLNLPGISVSVQQMLADFTALCGEEKLSLIDFQFDEAIARIVASWPAQIEHQTALDLGFVADGDFQSLIRQFLQQERGI